MAFERARRLLGRAIHKTNSPPTRVRNHPTKITVVFATARSGSTLLCRDITSIGGLGAPDEYFLRLMKADRSMRRSLTDCWNALDKGRDLAVPDVAGVKIMMAYAPDVHSWMSGHRKRMDPADAMQGILEWCVDNFSAHNFVSISRASLLDQAISAAVARSTGIYHIRADGRFRTKSDHLSTLDGEAINRAILRSLTNVSTVREQLNRFLSANAGRILEIDYDELATRPSAIHDRIRSHAKSNGFSPINERAQRKLVKIIDRRRSDEMKRNFQRFLRDLPEIKLKRLLERNQSEELMRVIRGLLDG